VWADVEVLVPLDDERDSVLHGLARRLLAIDLEYAGAAAADAAHIVGGEFAEAEAVVFEVELERVFTRHNASDSSQRVRWLALPFAVERGLLLEVVTMRFLQCYLRDLSRNDSPSSRYRSAPAWPPSAFLSLGLFQ
jgi:hypothetical protein